MTYDWPFISEKEFSEYNPLDWSPTTGRKQHDKKKYKLYWSPSRGGVWVQQ